MEDQLQQKPEIQVENQSSFETTFHKHQGTDAPRVSIFDLDDTLATRTSVSVDLSGAAITLVCYHTERAISISKAYLLYTEASSADAGITLEIGKESDRNYYYTGASEASKAIWYTKELTLLKKDVAIGDTITFYSPGSKTGTGEVMLIIEFKLR